jgi:hypothetical protein
MAKKELYGKEAERLYVIDQCTINEIAARLNLGEKTVRLWKAEGDWDAKREQYLANRRAFHERLYTFGINLLDCIEKDMLAGKLVDANRMYTLTKILPNLIKVKDYEDVVKQHEAEGEPSGQTGKKTTSPEQVIKMMEDYLGVQQPAPKP